MRKKREMRGSWVALNSLSSHSCEDSFGRCYCKDTKGLMINKHVGRVTDGMNCDLDTTAAGQFFSS